MALKLVRQWFVAFLVGYSLPSFAQPLRGVSYEAASLTIRSTCEAMLPAYCQGKYGFQVMASGEWRAGPDPEGRSFSGRLSRKENHALWDAAERLLGSPAKQQGECLEREAIPGVRESVTVRIEEREATLQGAGGELNPLCPPGQVAAAKLFARTDALMRRYYPRPFRARRDADAVLERTERGDCLGDSAGDGDANKKVVDGIIRACDAADFDPAPNPGAPAMLRRLWQQAGLKYSKFCPPVVADGPLLVPTYDGQVDVYELN
jgi:hypothetical protein